MKNDCFAGACCLCWEFYYKFYSLCVNLVFDIADKVYTRLQINSFAYLFSYMHCSLIAPNTLPPVSEQKRLKMQPKY